MLSIEVNVPVRFSEIDSLGILWHGHYIRYFEDGREAFGLKYGLGYMDVYAQGFSIPIVNINCSFKRPIRYNDLVKVETRYVDSPAAKLIFDYQIKHAISDEVLATGRSEQVFCTKSGELQLTIPDFFQKWKLHHKLVEVTV